jgi:two-component system, NarL family, sensor histidine kinase UhpB
MLRIAQEAIHNAKKHAGASRLSVRLEYKGDEVTVEVCDNGKGGAGNAAPGRYGLTGMRERAAAIGGTLELRSESGMGTEVRLRAPAAREQGRGTQ